MQEVQNSGKGLGMIYIFNDEQAVVAHLVVVKTIEFTLSAHVLVNEMPKECSIPHR
jgi:hypothetical protein